MEEGINERGTLVINKRFDLGINIRGMRVVKFKDEDKLEYGEKGRVKLEKKIFMATSDQS